MVRPCFQRVELAGFGKQAVWTTEVVAENGADICGTGDAWLGKEEYVVSALCAIEVAEECEGVVYKY